jgi:hypothetical protein
MRKTIVSEIPETIGLARTYLGDDCLAIYTDGHAAFAVAAPVLDDRYGLAVWLEKGSGTILGFPAILSVKIMLRSLCKRKKPKETRPWHWQLGPLSPYNIKLERNRKANISMLAVWNHRASYILYEYLKEWNLIDMVEDHYIPVNGPIDMITAFSSAKTKYEEILTALTQAMITGLNLPEPDAND